MVYFIPEFQRDYFDWLIINWVKKKGHSFYVYLYDVNTGELDISLRKHDHPLLIVKPRENYNEEREDYEEEIILPCPDCGAKLTDGIGGGEKCTKCNYWFCY